MSLDRLERESASPLSKTYLKAARAIKDSLGKTHTSELAIGHMLEFDDGRA